MFFSEPPLHFQNGDAKKFFSRNFVFVHSSHIKKYRPTPIEIRRGSPKKFFQKIFTFFQVYLFVLKGVVLIVLPVNYKQILCSNIVDKKHIITVNPVNYKQILCSNIAESGDYDKSKPVNYKQILCSNIPLSNLFTTS